MSSTQCSSSRPTVGSIGSEARIAAVFPLSTMQESVWLSDQLSSGNPAWNLGEAWRLRGPLNADCLRFSLDRLVRRHETLRTTFHANDGRPAQWVHEPRPFDFDCLAVEEHALASTLAVAAREPFSLEHGPLARARLYRVREDEHVLLFSMHHIVSDEWSMRVLMADLVELYDANVSGRSPQLPELPIQYGDFAVWHRQQLQSERVARDLEYWLHQLRKPLPETALPQDSSADACAPQTGRTDFLKLPADLVTRIKELGRQHGATLFMTLLAAFDTLIYRYSQQTDLLVGAPVAGRDQLETEHLAGLFVNTLPFRTRLLPGENFLELLANVRDHILKANAHQAAPVEKIIEALHVDRCGLRHPLFRTVFGLQPAAENSWAKAGFDATLVELDNGEAKFDWTLLATEAANGLSLRSEYNTQKHSPVFMAQVLGHFQNLLQEIVSSPSRPLSQLPLISPSERQSLLEQGRDSSSFNSAPQLSGSSLQALFETQVSRTPEATALIFGEVHRTYEQVNEEANQLAALLLQQGVGPEIKVALLLERSPEAVIAILAVLKAGGTYVPIDCATPADRVRFMLADSAAALLVTTSHLGSAFVGIVPKIVFLDTQRPLLETCSRRNPANRSVPEHPAYVIYTSGSTGKPKGVLVTHQNVIRLFQQTEPWFHFGTDDVWTLFHSCSFDFSVWEIFGALLYGGRLVVVPYLASRSPREFYSLLAREGVTVLNQTPSAFRQLIWAENSSPAENLSLRYIIFGGEALELQSLKPWFQRHGDRKPTLVNMYGITETTVHVTYRVIRASDLDAHFGSLIGVPIPDLKLYLLDEHSEPVPVGVAGEICVGGAGVARGYLNRPELNASRFVPDPFSSAAQATMYRSGDLARRTHMGELEYLGRIDQQVKIRGFRIELGEIESALNLHPAVRESVVLSDQTDSGDKRLIAYVVPANGSFDPQLLRVDLARQLPDYMVPAHIVALKDLPLNQNGKVDRPALPKPDLAASPAPAGAPPATDTENRVFRIWQELLGGNHFGTDDNFFSLGGHSLLATQVIARLEEQLHKEIPLRWLFESPTIRGFAAHLDAAGAQNLPNRALIECRREAQRAEELLSRIDQLSDEEVERLLGEESHNALSS